MTRDEKLTALVERWQGNVELAYASRREAQRTLALMLRALERAGLVLAEGRG